MIIAYIPCCNLLFFNLIADKRHLSTSLHPAPSLPVHSSLLSHCMKDEVFPQAPFEVNIWLFHIFAIK